jgi:hypothetical protein
MICSLIDDIDKLEQQTILPCEHAYLQKRIAAAAVVQHYKREEDNITNELLNKYYHWLERNWKKEIYSPKEKTDFFLFKCGLEKIILNDQTKISSFEQLKILAEIWKQPLKKERDSICKFLSFFMYKSYGIHLNLVENIFSILNSPWKPVMSPLANILTKNLSLKEIEQYFFGTQAQIPYAVEVLSDIDRFFSITSSKYPNKIFLNKQDQFDLFEAALVVHEFQHIQDSVSANDASNSLFSTERAALNAEKIFLHSSGTGKRGKHCWLESNLFYPLIFLQCELENLISEKPLFENLSEVCTFHHMKPISVSSLFHWNTPFQMGVYCAAVMDLEPSWKKFLIEASTECDQQVPTSSWILQ